TIASSPLIDFYFTALAPAELYALSLHDALPISVYLPRFRQPRGRRCDRREKRRLLRRRARAADGRRRRTAPPRFSRVLRGTLQLDRKSTRLNSSHVAISYAVFCLKKKQRQDLHH